MFFNLLLFMRCFLFMSTSFMEYGRFSYVGKFCFPIFNCQIDKIWKSSRKNIYWNNLLEGCLINSFEILFCCFSIYLVATKIRYIGRSCDKTKLFYYTTKPWDIKENKDKCHLKPKFIQKTKFFNDNQNYFHKDIIIYVYHSVE